MIASAIGGRDGHILYFWDVETGQLLRTFTEHGYKINRIAFSPDGQTLAIGSGYTIRGNDGGDLTLWNLETGTRLHTLVGHSYYISDVAFSPDGQTLTSASGEGTLRFWNVETGQLLYTSNDHTNGITDVAFSSDGRRLATVSGDSHAGTDPHHPFMGYWHTQPPLYDDRPSFLFCRFQSGWTDVGKWESRRCYRFMGHQHRQTSPHTHRA